MTTRRTWAALGGGVILAGAGVGYWTLGGGGDLGLTVGGGNQTKPRGRSAMLASVRATFDGPALDAFIEEQHALAEGSNESEPWRVLAEAHLERALLETSHKGMAVAKPTFAELPGVMTDNLKQAAAAAQRTEELGGEQSETQRIRAAVLSTGITGALSAMRLQGQISKLLGRAAELDPNNPHVAVAQGCRLLFAPRLLGGDPEKALELFTSAAEALPEDERPLVFAACAAHVQNDDDRARELLVEAVSRNARNAYAAEVLRRMRAGEDEPFARDLEP